MGSVKNKLEGDIYAPKDCDRSGGCHFGDTGSLIIHRWLFYAWSTTSRCSILRNTTRVSGPANTWAQISKYESVTTPGDYYLGTICCLIGLCVLVLYAHVTSKRDKQNIKPIISRDEFEKGKKKVPPEERIMDFLEKNKNKGFTNSEIVNNVDRNGFGDTYDLYLALERLVKEDQIKKREIHHVNYYSIPYG